MTKQGGKVHAYPCDVTDWASCVTCVAQVVKEVGPVDVLVNNAGITRDMTFKRMDKANWDVVIKTNLDSCFNMTKQVCDGMLDRGWGRIINISSVNGQKGAFGQVRRACTALPKPWRSRLPGKASPSTRFPRGTSAPRW
jgi:acetoacetyl-CoA reductase